ncbi:rho guanine nucleotide exchange factor 25-like isoform X1 [Bactrocera neohumeralis]|uniref:rho guanine nucleotide exchange factor 25-like isoform X1 n=2 Tax=Bactrocera neohumeralis TaxID=98809 RepID=UPI002165329A|nr:rho guanine nucleotide exchange factor 25-like isoform X1 [Bactrocera neohumeralis]XP_050333185.1 rho guanine nucleotide exchange factor 25-like isoform X1 [Bactrocera neohumeralis]
MRRKLLTTEINANFLQYNNPSVGKMKGNSAVDLSETEQIVKEETEQYEEKSKTLKPKVKNCDNSNNAYVSASNGCSAVGEKKEMIDIENALRLRQYAIDELITTEKSYIEDLKSIVDDYLAEVLDPKSDIPKPDDLKGGKERMVFGNIEAIYEWHKKSFLEALVRCRNSPADLGALIEDYLHKFDMYKKYFQNKPLSDHIVTTHLPYFDKIRQNLGSRLDLNDLLIKPVQRLPKYVLLFKEIAKYARAAGRDAEVVGVEKAMRVMGMICKAANEVMELHRLQKFEGEITEQGELLLHDKLYCIEVEKADRNAYILQRPRELYVFLFKQSIIFADIDGKKLQCSSPTYTYRSHIQVNKMQLKELENNRFQLKSTDPNKSGLKIICYASTVELTNEWLRILRNILQSLQDFRQAITNPIEYQHQQQQRH